MNGKPKGRAPGPSPRDSGLDADRRIGLPDHVRDLVTAHTALVDAYASTKLRFTFDGRLVGDLAEATVAEAFGLELCRVRTPGVDAHAPDGRSVQIKASGVGRGPLSRRARVGRTT